MRKKGETSWTFSQKVVIFVLIKCASCHIYRTDLESRVCYLKRNTRSIINNLGLEDMVSRKPGNRPNRRWSTGTQD